MKGNKSGITLIALVITIIVLLILAGISISMITGENGILMQASNAKLKNLEAQVKEEIELAVASSRLEERNYGKIDEVVLEEELVKIGASIDKYSPETNGSNLPWTVTKDGIEYQIDPDGNVTLLGNNSSGGNGSGEENNPEDEEEYVQGYIIDSIQDLVRFEQQVNGTYYNEETGENNDPNTFEGETITLTDDLDFEDDNSYDETTVIIGGTSYSLNGTVEGTQDLKTYLCEGENGVGWTPISIISDNGFLGTFDGNGHEISNIYILREISNDSADARYGLFGNNNGTIKNLGCINSKMSVKLDSSGTNTVMVGMISGYNYGDILNCYVDGEVTSESIGTSQSRAGGIAGSNKGLIKDCYNRAIIKSIADNNLSSAGGISGTGTTESTIECCYNISQIQSSNNTNTTGKNINVGGIVGNMLGTISYCYNIGTVNAEGTSNATFIGGVCGLLSSGSVKNCYNIGFIENNSSNVSLLFGMIIGKIVDSGECTNCQYLKQDSYKAIGKIEDTNISDDSLTEVSSVETIEKMPEILTILNKNSTSDSFKDDETNINNGYPILNWQ